VPIPDYKTDNSVAHLYGDSTKPLPSLPAVLIKPSHRLPWFFVGIYGGLVLLLLVAITPYALVHPLWWSLLLGVSLLLGLSLRALLRRHRFMGWLEFKSSCWHLEYFENVPGTKNTRPVHMMLQGDVEAVIWPWVIILYWRTRPAGPVGRRFTLVLMRDSLSEADFRQLKCWLRICLRPKG